MADYTKYTKQEMQAYAIAKHIKENQIVIVGTGLPLIGASLAKAAAKAAKAAAAAPDNAKLAEAAAKAQKVADDAAAGVAIPETFKDYLDKWVYSVKDHQELLNKIGGARLVSLKNAPHLGYSITHLK